MDGKLYHFNWMLDVVIIDLVGGCIVGYLICLFCFEKNIVVLKLKVSSSTEAQKTWINDVSWCP